MSVADFWISHCHIMWLYHQDISNLGRSFHFKLNQHSLILLLVENTSHSFHQYIIYPFSLYRYCPESPQQLFWFIFIFIGKRSCIAKIFCIFPDNCYFDLKYVTKTPANVTCSSVRPWTISFQCASFYEIWSVWHSQPLADMLENIMIYESERPAPSLGVMDLNRSIADLWIYQLSHQMFYWQDNSNFGWSFYSSLTNVH